jgi:hypothetical protein
MLSGVNQLHEHVLGNTIALFLCIASRISAAQSDILQDTLIFDSVKTENSTIVFEKAVFYFNLPDTQEVYMRPDLSSNTVLVGLKPPQDWGIPCRNDTSTHCTQLGMQNMTSSVTYLNQSSYAVQLSVPNPFRKDNTYNLNFTNLAANGLYSTNSSSPFVLGTTGVIGLGPQSPYYKNLFTHYAFLNDAFVFLFSYELDRTSQWWLNDNPRAYKNGTLSLNGYTSQDLSNSGDLKNVTVPRTSTFWTINVKQLMLGNQTLLADDSLKLCITNSMNSFLSVLPAVGLNRLINQKICEQDSNCSSSTNSPEQAPVLSVKVNSELELTLTGTDYAYRNDTNNSLGYAVSEDLQSWIDLGICDPDSRIGIGRLLFTKYALIFNYFNTGNNHIITVGFKKQPRLLTAAEKALLVGLAIALGSIVIIVLAIKLITDSRKSNSYLDSVSMIEDQTTAYSTEKS